MSYIISIPEPCSENWNEMNPTQKGAFCKSCKKEVVDFTTTSKIGLAKKIRKGENICGRFTSEQLNKPLPQIHRSQWKRNAAALGFISIMTLTTPMLAQDQAPQSKNPVEQCIVMGRIAAQPMTHTPVIITGNVKDIHAAVPNMTVTLKHTNISAKTDVDGNFSIALPPKSIYKSVLVFAAAGYITQEVVLDKKTKNIQLTARYNELMIMGEIAIQEIKKENTIQRLFKKK